MPNGLGAVVESHYPGRIRVRVPRSHRSDKTMEDIRSSIDGVSGVRNIYTNVNTGGVLLEYDPEMLDSGALTDLGRAANLVFDIDSVVSRGTESLGWNPPSPSAQKVIEGMRKLNNGVMWLTRGTMDARTAVPLFLLLLSLGRVFLSEKRPAAPWHSLMWYAYSMFLHWNRPMNGPGVSV